MDTESGRAETRSVPAAALPLIGISTLRLVLLSGRLNPFWLPTVCDDTDDIFPSCTMCKASPPSPETNSLTGPAIAPRPRRGLKRGIRGHNMVDSELVPNGRKIRFGISGRNGVERSSRPPPTRTTRLGWLKRIRAAMPSSVSCQGLARNEAAQRPSR